VKFYRVTAGDSLFEEGPVHLKALYAFDGVNTPVGPTDINDTSVIARLEAGSTRVLFTGDLNDRIGRYLAGNSGELRADILKVPHHGTEGVAPNVFFDRVSPLLAVVPSPLALWRSERSSRIREYFKKLKIPTLISGREGAVTVEFFSGTWIAKGERASR
jgi:beta-lactamase superfamily II metal-dependent hydrolase